MPKKIETSALNQSTEGANDMDNENAIIADNNLFDSEALDDASKPTAAATAGDKPETAPVKRQRRRKPPAETPAPILTLEVGAEVETHKDRENTVWHEIKSSQMTGTHLTGILGKIERSGDAGLLSIVDYKGQRIVIPLSEMMLSLSRPPRQSEDAFNDRISRVLNGMMGAEIDFVVRGISGSGDDRAVVASRRAAMLRLRRRFYLTDGANGKPQVYPGRIVEARIIAVGQLAIRVEIFGVETPIRNRDLSWGYIKDCREVYFVGDSVQVRVKHVSGDTAEDIRIGADIKSLTEDDTREKLLALKPQTNCMGRVTDTGGGIVFINLVDGVRAISHKCFDSRKPGRGDDVLFVCTRIDEEGGVAVGIISRIVKRNI